MCLVDRSPDFYRRRLTRCASCGQEQAFDAEWFERWPRGEESCPSCGADCTAEAATRVAADPADPALDDGLLASLSWWHTSTHADWPPANFDPAARIDELTVQRMGGLEAVERWAARQKQKALRVGTYEAAVQNMLRRIGDQGDEGQTFYLYRVRLRPNLNVGPGLSEELVDFLGDVALARACPSGIDATRYLNSHEDPGGISLALGRGAIHSVQPVQIPLQSSARGVWRTSALKRLAGASADPIAVVEPGNELTRLRPKNSRGPTMTSKRKQEQTHIRDEMTAHLPAGIKDQVRVAVGLDDGIDSATWCDYLAAVLQLIDNPEVVVRKAQMAVSRLVRDR